MIGIAVLYTTTDVKLVRNYMIALWLADIGHLAVTYHVLGPKRYFDIENWNAMAYGNIGVTVRSPLEIFPLFSIFLLIYQGVSMFDSVGVFIWPF